MSIEANKFEELKTKVSELCFDAMNCDGAHHKQWYFREIARTILTQEQYDSWREWFIEVNEDGEYDHYDGGIAP